MVLNNSARVFIEYIELLSNEQYHLLQSIFKGLIKSLHVSRHPHIWVQMSLTVARYSSKLITAAANTGCKLAHCYAALIPDAASSIGPCA